MRCQIFLDQHYYGPGKIDGDLGKFTLVAVANYNKMLGVAADNWYYLLKHSSREVKEIYRAFRIPEGATKFVTPDLPLEPSKQAEREYMGYRSLAEYVAERFHTDETFLGKLNPHKDTNALKVGDIVLVPNVHEFKIEEVAKFKSYGEDESLSAHSVVVDTEERVATFYGRDGKMFASFPITPGQKKFIPYGEWQIKVMVTTPTFRWDKKMLEEGERGEEFYQIPIGPNSPVGIFWAGLNKSGIGLHGTNNPRKIGRSQSAGCIRLSNWDAIRLSQLVRPGSKVVVK